MDDNTEDTFERLLRNIAERKEKMNDITYTKINITEHYTDLTNQIINELDKIHFQYNKFPDRIPKEYRSKAKTINFGHGFRRQHDYGDYVANSRFPKAYELLKQFVKYIAPNYSYNVITVNRNVCMSKHIDKNNKHKSIFTCIGNFQGGGLVVYDTEPKLYQCKNYILEFNGSKYYHETQPFTGQRYSIIIYKHKEQKQADINEIVQTSIKWGLIEEQLEALQWKNSIKVIENNLLKSI